MSDDKYEEMSLSYTQLERVYLLKDKIKAKWTDSYGFITIINEADETDPERGIFDSVNQNLFSAEYYLFLYVFGALTNEDAQHIEKLINSVRTKDSAKNDIPGLFNRHPRVFDNVKSDDVVSHDEYTGIAAMAFMGGWKGVPQEILEYGRKTGYSFNNWKPYEKGLTKDGIRYWRQGVHIAFYQLMGKEWPSVDYIFWFFLATVVTSFRKKKETSGKIMAWLRLELIQDRHWFFKMLREFFMWRLRRQYGKYPISALFAIYYHQHPEHPYHELARIYDEVS